MNIEVFEADASDFRQSVDKGELAVEDIFNRAFPAEERSEILF
jgi:hypothetical protein